MKSRIQIDDPKLVKFLTEDGERLLNAFHYEYERSQTGPHTEFRRGQFAHWKQMLFMLFEESDAETIVLEVSNKTGLSIPPAGTLSPDKTGYEGPDSASHGGYVGKLE
jgi:hypothetical protein